MERKKVGTENAFCIFAPLIYVAPCERQNCVLRNTAPRKKGRQPDYGRKYVKCVRHFVPTQGSLPPLLSFVLGRDLVAGVIDDTCGPKCVVNADWTKIERFSKNFGIT